jgi:Bacterial membrane protein YfhO
MDLLPGLLVAGLAALGLFLLRRGWDPVPFRVAAIFSLVVLGLFGSSLFAGRVLLPLDLLTRMPPFQLLEPAETPGNPLQMDLVTMIIPLQAQVRRTVAAGEWPLWNDLAGTGMPLLGDPQAQALQPLIWLTSPLALHQAVGAQAALRVFCALLFTFLFLRRQGLGEGPALFGGLAFGLSGFVLVWVGWPIANAAVLLPLVLYAIAWVHDRGARRDVLLLTLAVAALIVAGHPETILYGLALAAAFAVSRLFAGPVERRRPAFLRCSCAGLLALGLTAPAWLPAVEYLPQSQRHEVVERRNLRLAEGGIFQGWTTPAERRASREALAQRVVPVVAPGSYGEAQSGLYWGDMNFNERASGFAGTSVLLLGLLACVPTRARRLPQERLFLAAALASLIIVARPPGLVRLFVALPVLNSSATFHHRVLLVLVLALSCVGACFLQRWEEGDGDRRRWLPPALAAVLALLLLGAAWISAPPPEMAAADARRMLLLTLQLAALAATAGILVMKVRRRAWLLAALVTGELLLFYGSANPGLPRRLYYPSFTALDVLRQGGGEFRVAAVGGTFLPNVASVYGLADLRSANPFKPFLAAQATAPINRSARAAEDRFLRPAHPLYGRLAARYLLVPRGTKLRAPFRRIFRDASLWVYERPDARAVLFLPDTEPSSGASLNLAGISSAHWQAEVNSPETQLVASSLYQDGGWGLLLDRRPHPTRRADGPFLAASVPAGRHRIDLLYRPAGFVLGCLLAALALAGAALAFVPPPKSAAGNAPESRFAGELDAHGKAARHVLHELGRAPRIPGAHKERRHQFRVGVDASEGPNVADVERPLLLGR